jgi:predicted DNA-binding protein YlxM (UPF0122 family)
MAIDPKWYQSDMSLFEFAEMISAFRASKDASLQKGERKLAEAKFKPRIKKQAAARKRKLASDARKFPKFSEKYTASLATYQNAEGERSSPLLTQEYIRAYYALNSLHFKE